MTVKWTGVQYVHYPQVNIRMVLIVTETSVVVWCWQPIIYELTQETSKSHKKTLKEDFTDISTYLHVIGPH